MVNKYRFTATLRQDVHYLNQLLTSDLTPFW